MNSTGTLKNLCLSIAIPNLDLTVLQQFISVSHQGLSQPIGNLE